MKCGLLGEGSSDRCLIPLLEAILTKSDLQGAQHCTASLPPPRQLLELHTDGKPCRS